MIAARQPVADALVLFGATGDLAKRKLFPALYHLEHRGLLKIPVIGVARSDWNDAAFCQHAHDSILQAIPDALASAIEPLMKRLDLVQGDYADPATWTSLRDTLDRCGSKNAVFYMAIPPTMFPPSPRRSRRSASTSVAASSSRSRSGATSPVRPS